jgi:hypothetical protein
MCLRSDPLNVDRVSEIRVKEQSEPKTCSMGVRRARGWATRRQTRMERVEISPNHTEFEEPAEGPVRRRRTTGGLGYPPSTSSVRERQIVPELIQIEPFTVSVGDEVLTDLRDRIERTR